MKLQPHEMELVGKWLADGGTVHGNAICERIEWLIKNQLREITFSPQYGEWETLFQDPEDGRFWERTYPQGEMHGGGPPALRCLSRADALKKYDFENPISMAERAEWKAAWEKMTKHE